MTFTFNFTLEKFSQCIKNKQQPLWYNALIEILPKYAINTPKRVASWLSQCGHESGDFVLLQENLNYGAKGLRTIFPKYFLTEEMAQQYERKPEKIANKVYSSRMGNGDENSGEGWKYRGRGLIQITGKDNYKRCSETLYGNDILINNPDLLCETDGAIRSACWFWNSKNINADADREDVLTITKKINGGTHGLEDRTKRYQNYIKILT